jgi:hypothetical protein
MVPRHLIAFSLAVVSVACTPAPPAAPASSLSGTDLVILRETLSGNVALSNQYRLLSTDVANCSLDSLSQVLDPRIHEAIGDCNARQAALPRFTLAEASALNRQLIAPDSVVRSAGRYLHRWPDFQWTSRPGYSEDSAVAVVALGISCGSLCGSSELLMWRRDHGQWKDYTSLEFWIH